jgi:hypothetical protein
MAVSASVSSSLTAGRSTPTMVIGRASVGT